MLCQHICLTLNLLIQPGGCCGIVFRDVIQLIEAAARRARQPADRQADAFPLLREAPRHAARLAALLRFTTSCESHAA